MAILEMKYYGSSVLKRVAKPVKQLNREIITLAANMLETMYHYYGVGLAAPQVGVSKRLMIVDCGEEYQDQPYIMINPQVVHTEGTQYGQEGCLSLPELFVEVERPKIAVVKAINLQGEEFEVRGEDLLARALLHEIDHLDGKIFTEMVEERTILDKEIPLLKERIQKILKGEIPAVPEIPQELLEEEATPV